uniref:Ig-like domain-containing protein n=1 Tax=Cyprinodon variegatus TaxID=28743 RepID=A0A3Q2DA85_CYPVA
NYNYTEHYLFVLSASQDPLSVNVEVWEGAPSVLLPCDYKEQLLDVVTVKWSRFDLNPTTVHKRRKEDDLQEQNQQFRGRTSMRPDALDSLDFNLTLTELQPSDSGVYICSMIDKKEEILSEVQLYVRGQLPWGRSFSGFNYQYSIENNKIEWKIPVLSHNGKLLCLQQQRLQ